MNLIERAIEYKKLTEEAWEAAEELIYIIENEHRITDMEECVKYVIDKLHIINEITYMGYMSKEELDFRNEMEKLSKCINI